MTQKKKYYFCFALAISICMTDADSGISVVFFTDTWYIGAFYARECMYVAVNIFNRKCLNHVGTLIITGSLFLFLLARNTFLFLFSFSI